MCQSEGTHQIAHREDGGEVVHSHPRTPLVTPLHSITITSCFYVVDRSDKILLVIFVCIISPVE